jgi:hypothetical protein
MGRAAAQAGEQVEVAAALGLAQQRGDAAADGRELAEVDLGGEAEDLGVDEVPGAAGAAAEDRLGGVAGLVGGAEAAAEVGGDARRSWPRCRARAAGRGARRGCGRCAGGGRCDAGCGCRRRPRRRPRRRGRGRSAGAHLPEGTGAGEALELPGGDVVDHAEAGGADRPGDVGAAQERGGIAASGRSRKRRPRSARATRWRMSESRAPPRVWRAACRRWRGPGCSTAVPSSIWPLRRRSKPARRSSSSAASPSRAAAARRKASAASMPRPSLARASPSRTGLEVGGASPWSARAAWVRASR